MTWEEPVPTTAEEEIWQLVHQLEASMTTAEVLGYLRTQTEYTEEQIKSALDGYPYHVYTDIEKNDIKDWVRCGYDIRNYYDGNLMGQLLTTWTYWGPTGWDQKTIAVRDMTVDDGIGIKRRTIVHHRENNEPESVETITIKPEPGTIESTMDRVFGALGL